MSRAGRRTRALLAGVLAGLLAGAAPAADPPPPTPAERIEEARALLAGAERRLAAGGGREERAAALGQAVRAHEAALAALRAGLRALAAEDRRLVAQMQADHDRLSRLLGALQALSLAPRSALLAHPARALDAARAASLVAGMTPALQAAIAALGRQLDALRAVRTGQEIARAEAGAALAGLQRLRGEASQSREAGGRDPGAQVTRAELRAQAEAAAARARDLAGLAEALRASLPGPGAAAQPFASRRGQLVAPVAGRITGLFGGVDPWGRTGQGVTFTAPAWGQVIAPMAATVRYAGPLVDYGEVLILEPEEGWLMVLAGLAATGRQVGETVLAGEWLGDLGGPLPSSEEFLLEAGGNLPQIQTEELYVELRQAGTALDPAPWFATTGR